MKLTQKKCNIMLPKMKSANALWKSCTSVQSPSVGFENSERFNIPLVGNALKVCLVLWVGLHAQADRKDELANSRREAREESVERL